MPGGGHLTITTAAEDGRCCCRWPTPAAASRRSSWTAFSSRSSRRSPWARGPAWGSASPMASSSSTAAAPGPEQEGEGSTFTIRLPMEKKNGEGNVTKCTCKAMGGRIGPSSSLYLLPFTLYILHLLAFPTVVPPAADKRSRIQPPPPNHPVARSGHRRRAGDRPELPAHPARRRGTRCECCQDPQAGLQAALSGDFDVILAGPDDAGPGRLEILRQIKAAGVSSEVVIITGHATVESAVEAMKHGAPTTSASPFRPTS